MKVVFSSNSSWNLYNFRKGLIKNLINKNYEIIILAPKDNYTILLENMGCKFYNININSRGLHLLTDIKLILNYYRILKIIKPNFFVSFTVKPNIYGSFVANFLNYKVINTVSGLGKVFINKSILEFIIIFLYQFSFRKSYKVFFHNDDDLKLFLNKKIIKNHQSHVIPGSGVDIKSFNFKPLPKAKDSEYNFLYIGRMIYEKGVVDLIKAAEEVCKIYPNINFILIGQIKKNNKDFLDLNYINNISKNIPIHYLGESNNVKKFIEECHCVILPSYREGLPKSILEAGSIGRPSLVSNVPGCRHIIRENVNGYLFEVKNYKSLAKSIVRFIELNDTEKHNMSLNSRKIIEENFNEDIVIKKYLESFK